MYILNVSRIISKNRITRYGINGTRNRGLQQASGVLFFSSYSTYKYLVALFTWQSFFSENESPSGRRFLEINSITIVNRIYFFPQVQFCIEIINLWYSNYLLNCIRLRFLVESHECMERKSDWVGFPIYATL